MKFGIVVFPGSNCDADCWQVINQVLKQEAHYIWYNESEIKGFDAIILPGGFSYGDYLRTGAIARFAPVMQGVIRFAARGGLVLGICNGFQILLEAGLLPGAMLRNQSLKFICEPVYLKVCRTDTAFTNQFQKEQIIKLPIAHGEGNYYCNAETLKELQDENRILFTYSSLAGEESPACNPNGSIANIAGIMNSRGNVLGMMPHPERYAEAVLGGDDGYYVFASMVSWFKGV